MDRGKPTSISIGSEEDIDFEDAIEDEDGSIHDSSPKHETSVTQTALDAVVASFNIGLEQLRQPQGSGNAIGPGSGSVAQIIRRPSGIAPLSAAGVNSRQRPGPRQTLQHASPSRAEYRKLAPPRHTSQASKQRPKPPSLPPPQSFSGGTSEGTSFVGGAHLPMSMFINAGSSSIASRGVPENVFDLFDAERNSRAGHSEFEGNSNVFDIFNEPSLKESDGMTSMTLSDFLQNENPAESGSGGGGGGGGGVKEEPRSLPDYLPTSSEPSYSQKSAPPSPPAITASSVATSSSALRLSAPNRSTTTVKPTVLLPPSNKPIPTSAQLSSTPPAGEHVSANEDQRPSGVRDSGFASDPFAGIEAGSSPDAATAQIPLATNSRSPSAAPSPAASRTSVESVNASVSTATSTHKSSLSNSFHMAAAATDAPPSQSSQSKVLDAHAIAAIPTIQPSTIATLNPTKTSQAIEEGCFGFLSESASAVRSALGLVPPLRAAGYVTVGSSQRDYIEFSSLALCQRLEHTSAAFVRLAQARQALVADRLNQLQFQRQQRFAEAEAAEKPNAGGGGGISDSGGGASVGSDSGIGLGERRLSDASISSSIDEGSQVTSPHIGPPSDQGGSAPRGAVTKSYYTGSIDGYSVDSVGGKGGNDRRVVSRLPPLTEAEATAQEEFVKSSIPSLPARAPLETIWTMKFSPDGKYLAAAGGTDQGAVIRVWRVRPWRHQSNGSDEHESAGSTIPSGAIGEESRRQSKSETAPAIAAGGSGGRARSSSSHSRSSTSSHGTDVSGSTGAGVASVVIEKESSVKAQPAQPSTGAAAAAAAALAQLDLYSKKAGVGSQQSTVVVGPAAEIPLHRPAAGQSSTHTLTSPALAAARMTGGNAKRKISKRTTRGGENRLPSSSFASSTARIPSSLTSVALVTHGQPFFESEPVQEWLGHESHVVDISWSKSNLLLSASMDGWVRLWHVSQADCLHKFQHPDCVTSVAFYPAIGSRDGSTFISGCFDRKLRLWSLETGRVTAWQAAPAMITSAAFSPDGRIVIAGLFNGICVIYSADGLVSLGTVDCRNRRGPFRHGRKVTGIDFTFNSSHALITTNDSRIRLVDLLSKQTVTKFSGLRNQNLQVRATLDASAKRLVAGSEDGRVIIWRTQNDLFQPALNPRMTGYDSSRVRSFEFFVPDEGGQSHESEAALRAEEMAELGTQMRPAVTVALFAPQEALEIARPSSLASKWCATRGLQATAALAGGGGGGGGGGSRRGAEEEEGGRRKDDRERTSAMGTAAGTGIQDEDGGIAGSDERVHPSASAKGLALPSTIPAEAAALALELSRARESAGLEERLATHGVLICADSRGVLRVYENVGPMARL